MNGDAGLFDFVQERGVVSEVPCRFNRQDSGLPAMFGQILYELGDTLHPAQTHRGEVVSDDENAAQRFRWKAEKV